MRRDVCVIERFQRRRIAAIAVIILRGGAVGELAVALALVIAKGAHPLHVAQQQRLSSCEAPLVDPKLLEHLWQFICGVPAMADQLFEIVGRHPQVVRDPVELRAIELAYLVQLAAMLQPGGKGLDEILDDGIRPACGAHARLHWARAIKPNRAQWCRGALRWIKQG